MFSAVIEKAYLIHTVQIGSSIYSRFDFDF